ncbi:hypothetical protein SynBIOSU31_00199 [Synechococcus sp. BIOS-U3-1]|nr:hypothetical protein SynBIOSU31_00199 [Synechococcus sp. BIOS-U3-1]
MSSGGIAAASISNVDSSRWDLIPKRVAAMLTLKLQQGYPAMG